VIASTDAVGADRLFADGTFPGFRRADGRVGVRNLLAIIPSVICANVVTERIAAQVTGAVAIPHPHGCAQVGDDVPLTERILAGVGANPNVGAVLVVGLGCETCQSGDVASLVRRLAPGKPVASFSIQEAGGSIKSIARGVEVAHDLRATIASTSRVPVRVEELIVATQCGETDTTTDSVANPTIGVVADDVVRAGGTVLLGETPEWMGIAADLALRARDAATGDRLHSVVENYRRGAHAIGATVIGPEGDEDVVAGHVTARDRALGCVTKGGSSSIGEVLEFGARPTRRGLAVMDTPAHDVVSITAMAAAGAQVCFFATGRGTPVGSALMPVIKVTGNPRTATRMADNVDLVFDGVDRPGDARLLREVFARVVCGEEVVAEVVGQQDFAIHRVAPTV
jgi:altronate dehydratase large subunit